MLFDFLIVVLMLLGISSFFMAMCEDLGNGRLGWAIVDLFGAGAVVTIASFILTGVITP